MQERYLYRGKRIDNGEWVEGYFVQTVESSYIVVPYKHSTICGEGSVIEVDPSTICQCTGLKDKNGNLIWENDIVFVRDADGCSGQMDTGVGEISFIEGLWYIGGRVQNGLYDIDKCFHIEVVGSAIDDNPELLEV